MAPRPRRRAPAPDVPANVIRQVAQSGTPVSYGGLTQPDEYVRELMDPIRRMEVFEEMRNSDDAVNTAIQARESMMLQANWVLTPPDDSESSREILEFVEDILYPVLDNLIRFIGGGAVQYGVGVVQPVFAWADRPFKRTTSRGNVRRMTGDYGRKLYLRKLVHVRQKTINAFGVNDDGDLKFARQFVNTSRGFQQIDVPAELLLMWTYNQQGDDYWGLPPTRHAYKAWTFKNQIERLNILGLDRFGVGTPVAEAGPEWQTPDYAKMEEYLAAWRSGTDTYLIHPHGGKITIQAGQGQLYVSILEWVKFYALAISLNYLTQGTQLAINSNTGARALGETMYEQAEGVVQADCEALASIINEWIVQVVDWNFGEQEGYPIFTPSQRVRATSVLAEVVVKLVSGNVIHWIPEVDEPWLRDRLKLPEISLDQIAAAEAEKAALALEQAALMGAAADPNADPNEEPPPEKRLPPGGEQRQLPAGKKPTGAEAEQKRKLGRGTDWTRRLVRERNIPGRGLARVPEPATRDTSHRTPEFTQWEEGILKPRILSSDLDLQTARAADEVRNLLARVDQMLIREVERIASEGGAVALSESAERIRVPAGLRNKLRRALLLASERARLYGANAVTTEIARQDDPDSAIRTPPWSEFRARVNVFVNELRARRATGASWIAALARSDDDANADPESTRDDLVRAAIIFAAIGAALADEIARREAAVRTAIMTTLAAGAPDAATLATQVAATARSGLEDLSPYRTQENLRGVVNVGFGEGRRDGLDNYLEAFPNGIVSKFYTAVLDGGTCDECAKWDGAEFPLDYPEDSTGVRAPNPRCYGTLKRCRCVWLYKTAEETDPSVAPTRGPIF